MFLADPMVEGEEASDWIEVESFVDSGPSDRHFLWSSSSGEISFGPAIRYPDGHIVQHGAVPPHGARVTVTGYRHGGGSTGNVGPGTLVVLPSPVPDVERVENIMPARGGVDGETIDNAKLRGPEILRRGHRAVTRNDYESLVAESDPSIARVRCLAPSHSGGPVRVLIVPHVGLAPGMVVLDDLALPDWMFYGVQSTLEERRVLGVEVEVGTPHYQGASVAVLLKVRPGRPEEAVRMRAVEAIYGLLDPVVGGLDGRGWPFDLDLTVGSVYRMLESIDGVERVDEVVLFDHDLRTGERTGPGRARIQLAPDTLFLSARHNVVVQ